MQTNDYAQWKILAWRLVRGAAATAFAQTLAQIYLGVNWTNPAIAIKTVSISFLSGFLMALSLAVKSQISTDPNHIVNKLPV